MSSDDLSEISISFASEEARCLAGAVLYVLDNASLTDSQKEILKCVAGKFVLAGETVVGELIECVGPDRASEIAKEHLAEFPDVEVVV